MPWTRCWIHYIDGLAQDCSISIANALEILQSCTNPSIQTLLVQEAPCSKLLPGQFQTAVGLAFSQKKVLQVLHDMDDSDRCLRWADFVLKGTFTEYGYFHSKFKQEIIKKKILIKISRSHDRLILKMGIPAPQWSGETILISNMSHNSSFLAGEIVIYFIRVAFGGPAFGWIMGKITILWLVNIFNDALTEITITLTFTYLTFFIGRLS